MELLFTIEWDGESAFVVAGSMPEALRKWREWLGEEDGLAHADAWPSSIAEMDGEVIR